MQACTSPRTSKPSTSVDEVVTGCLHKISRRSQGEVLTKLYFGGLQRASKFKS